MIAALVLSGCASQQKIVWDGNGRTPQDFARDKYTCVQESRTSWSAGGSGLTGIALMAGAESQANAKAQALFKYVLGSSRLDSEGGSGRKVRRIGEKG